MWGLIDRTTSTPKNPTSLTAWETKDAQIVYMIVKSIKPQMINNLHSFSTANKMWDYLKNIYNQDNVANAFNS